MKGKYSYGSQFYSQSFKINSQGVLSLLSSYVGSGLASTVHPKQTRYFKHPKNIWNFSNP